MIRVKAWGAKACAIGLAAALPLTLAACGESSNSSSSEGSVLRYGVDLTPMGGAQFDPLNDGKSLVPNRNSWNDLIFDRLIYRDEDGSLQPGLLQEWKVVDPLTLDVTVRSGVEFQDGTKLDAAALKFNWDRAMAEESLARPADFQNVTGVEVVSENVARIKYSSPATAFTLNNTFVLSRGFGVIASPTAVKKLGAKFNSNPVGAGPYKFESMAAGQKLSLRAWDGYWEPKNQKLDGVDFIQTARGAATMSALQSGQIDLARITETDVPALESRKGLTTVSKPGTEVLYYFVNLTRPPFNNLAARKALSYAFDRGAINEAAYGGRGVETDTLYYPGSPFHVDGLESAPAHDPKKAAQMLRAAGVPEGTTIGALVQNIPEMQAGAEVLQAQLKEVGINLKLNVTPNFVDEMLKKPDSLFASTINYNLPASFLNSNGTYNMGYKSEKFEQATKLSLGADDEAALNKAYSESQQALLDDLPIFFFAQEPVTLGMSDKVKGVGEVRSDLEGPVLAGVYLK